MASTSPSPDSSPFGAPPPPTPPPPSSSHTPPRPPVEQPNLPPSPSNATSPAAPPPLPSAPPPTPSPPPAPVASPPPTVTSPLPQSSPPPASPPQMASPTPVTLPPPQSSPTLSPPVVPPPPSNSPPPTPPSLPPSSPPTPTPPSPPSDPPVSPPTPPTTNPPPRVSPPPPSATPPANSPPLPEPPKSAPPPSVPPKPPLNPPPPPPPSEPPRPSPPPRTSPLPSPAPPQGSPSPPSPPPSSRPPQSSPPSPVLTPPPSRSPPVSGSPPRQSPPSAVVVLPPPPSRPSPPPSPSLVSPVAPDSSNSTGGNGIGTGGILAIGLVLGFLLVGLIGTAVWCLSKRKKKVPPPSSGYIVSTSPGSFPKPEPELLEVEVSAPSGGSGPGPGRDSVSSQSEPSGLGNSRPWITYGELAEATNGFSHQNLLGEGGFGSVYRGRLSDGREVAVKQLKVGGGQGDREFRAEVEIISRVHHRHLVSLVGYCISEEKKLLVYDYLPNNTLHFHLHAEGRPVLDWAARVKIAVGAARGIAYLHEDCHPRIIHRDIKSSNILLDENFEARVSDFGLAKLFLDSNTHVTTRVMGTFGYMAPEYASSGKLTDKSDVFSFGVVLLELITGRKPVDTNRPLGDESLVEWARPLLSHALDTEEFELLVDPRLEKNYVDSEMFRMIEAAAACVRHSSAKRPRMIQVVRAFDVMSTMDLTNGMRVGESEMFNSAEQSAEIRLFRRMAFGSNYFSTDFFSQGTANGKES